jgi:putative Mg2+ transporter-C (MgtC) family protein
MHPIAAGRDLVEILLRLGVAVLAGAVVGLDRDLMKRPAGLRTHALVALGSALITAITIETVGPDDPGALTRTIQGVITGVGFLGAGVILHPASERGVRGLTTAASIWLVACLGVGCGAGYWLLSSVATAMTLAILVLGKPLERGLHRLADRWFAAGPYGGDDGGASPSSR